MNFFVSLLVRFGFIGYTLSFRDYLVGHGLIRSARQKELDESLRVQGVLLKMLCDCCNNSMCTMRYR